MVLAQGSILQAFLGTLLSAMYLVFQAQAAPFLDLQDDYLATACNLCLLIIFFGSVAAKYDALVILYQIQGQMTIEEKD